jgi:hypothetical protein
VEVHDHAQTPRIDDAVAHLRRLAAGRADLLAEPAGISGGYWTV